MEFRYGRYIYTHMVRITGLDAGRSGVLMSIVMPLPSWTGGDA